MVSRIGRTGRSLILALGIAALPVALSVPALGSAAQGEQQPFKLGTFQTGDQPFVGMVLGDSRIVEVEAANRDFEYATQAVSMPMATDMIRLIERYEYGLRVRLHELANWLVTSGRGRSAEYVHEVDALRTLPPLMYPGKILNAAGNYYGHVGEAQGREEQQRIAEERRRDRGTPYLFLKPSTPGVVVGNGHDIVLPSGRDRIDWECELAAVIGRGARHVTAAEAEDHVFGYTILLDMSDRGGRPGEEEPRSDWLVGKGHDTFAPMGPWITPKEFMPDPMSVSQTLSVNDTLMQDGHSSNMIHDLWELIEYGSWVLTLRPGDVVAAGSPAGTGMSRSVREEQVFLDPGDRIVATIEGIGTLTHTTRAESREAVFPTWQ